MTFPITVNIDATSLRTSDCMLAFWRTIVEGYRQPLVSSSIIYGVAVHKFIDTMCRTGNMKQARDAAKKAFDIPKLTDSKKQHLSDWNHCLTTAFDYWESTVSKETNFDILQMPDGKPATECTFRFLYYKDEYLEVWLAGTMDKIGQFKRGCFAIGDYKTTSSWDNQSYFKQYELSIQLRFYVLALKWMAEHYPESMLGKIGQTRVGAFIDAVFIKPKAVENVYKRSEVYQFRQDELDEVRAMLDSKVAQLSRWAKLIATEQATRPTKDGILHGTCEKKFGKCFLWNTCAAPDDIAKILLARDFIQKPYHPLKFNE